MLQQKQVLQGFLSQPRQGEEQKPTRLSRGRCRAGEPEDPDPWEMSLRTNTQRRTLPCQSRAGQPISRTHLLAHMHTYRTTLRKSRGRHEAQSGQGELRKTEEAVTGEGLRGGFKGKVTFHFLSPKMHKNNSFYYFPHGTQIHVHTP